MEIQSVSGVSAGSQVNNDMFGELFHGEMKKGGLDGRSAILTMRLEHMTALQTQLNESDLTVEEKDKYSTLIEKIIARIQDRLDKMEDKEPKEPKDVLAFLMQVISQIGVNLQGMNADSDSGDHSDLDLAILDAQDSPFMQSTDESASMFHSFQAMMTKTTFRPPHVSQDDIDEIHQDMTMIRELKEKLA